LLTTIVGSEAPAVSDACPCIEVGVRSADEANDVAKVLDVPEAAALNVLEDADSWMLDAVEEEAALSMPSCRGTTRCEVAW